MASSQRGRLVQLELSPCTQQVTSGSPLIRASCPALGTTSNLAVSSFILRVTEPADRPTTRPVQGPRSPQDRATPSQSPHRQGQGDRAEWLHTRWKPVPCLRVPRRSV